MPALRWLGAAAALTLAIGLAQEELDVVVNGGGNLALCNSTLDQANGTGFFSFNPDFTMAKELGSQNPLWSIPEATWAITVKEQANGRIATSLWLDTNGVDYWDDELTQFDACMMMIGPPFPQNTLDLSQNDPGDCSVMITAGCREALTQTVAAEALLLTSYASPGEYSNLTASSLPWICDQVFNKFQHGWPKECSRDFGSDDGNSIPAQPYWGEITGNQTEHQLLSSNCPVNGSDGRQYLGTVGFDLPQKWYDSQMRQATPVLTVYFTVANAAARINIATSASAQMNCLRVTNVTEGSRVAPPLPSGTPYPSSSLTDADIAGVAVGSAAFVFILVAGAFFLLRRRRIRRALQAEGKGESDDRLSETHELERLDKAELTGADRKPEIGGTHISEVKGTDGAAELSNPKPEIDGAQILQAGGPDGAAELEGNSRWSIHSSRVSISSYDTAASSI